jgi:hypothetical protein
MMEGSRLKRLVPMQIRANEVKKPIQEGKLNKG